MNQNLMSAALEAAARGWPVHPLRPAGKGSALHGERSCTGRGPCTNGHVKWEQRATLDTERIRRTWQTGAYNIGIATGPARLLVVDLDVPKAKGSSDAPCGATNFQALCERAGQPWPATHTVRTPSGGLHLYFCAPGEVKLHNTVGLLGPLIDTRAWGGYVVGPGSITPGGAYEVATSASAVDVPGWLFALLLPAPLPPQRRVRITLHSRSRPGRYLRAAVEGELQRVTSSGPHQHNTALYRASVALGQLVAGGALAAQEVTEWLTIAGTSVGQSEREARATIASGLNAGAKRPRKVGS
ncbi:bifunctional DNA primase/polymerase [Streptomyces alboflavus]|uniref:bifunctional DNA primase/polymerase n=1 Tax=Streptomyces alboflavus TaxID=67267 RepID=UPI000F656BE1|nr:bifunctional DNA primase/polymerase [Streptomyces alboflavus]